MPTAITSTQLLALLAGYAELDPSGYLGAVLDQHADTAPDLQAGCIVADVRLWLADGTADTHPHHHAAVAALQNRIRTHLA